MMTELSVETSDERIANLLRLMRIDADRIIRLTDENARLEAALADAQAWIAELKREAYDSNGRRWLERALKAERENRELSDRIASRPPYGWTAERIQQTLESNVALSAENAHLRRALDAASRSIATCGAVGLVLGSDDTALQVAMEREEVK